MRQKRGPISVRFWNHIESRAPDECWIWTGARSHNGAGYGLISAGGRGTPLLGAHRVSFEIHNGPISSGLFVCHRCDQPACVNPAHLFLGTHADNMRDAAAKERLKPNGRTQLTPKQVSAIRKDARSLRKIAADYGVCHQAIHYVKQVGK